MSPERRPRRPARALLAGAWLTALLSAGAVCAQSAAPVGANEGRGARAANEPKDTKEARDVKRERLYLTSLALVVDGARRLIGFCEGSSGDAELARFARPLAERYVELSGRMLPTPKTAVVHPHLVLVVENLERALDAAAASDTGSYQKRVRIAREELLNLEAVLRQLKLRLPEPAR